jgi:hypothetical protein
LQCATSHTIMEPGPSNNFQGSTREALPTRGIEGNATFILFSAVKIA